MAVPLELQNQWEAFLKLLQVREPKLYEHLKFGRTKEITKYNLIVYAQTPDDLREIEVGLKVYQDKVQEFLPLIYGTAHGVKTELASEEDWQEAAPTAQAPTAQVVSLVQPQAPAAPVINLGSDQNELLKVLEASIRQKVEKEIREAVAEETAGSAVQGQMFEKIREDFQAEEDNRRQAVRMALMTEGDNTLTQLVMAWQQAKQNGEGGPQWQEVKQRLLELLDATVQLINS
jgi:hypothetical protein